MNRYDDNDWRSERHHGFREDHDSGRTAGEDSHQPFSDNPYGYYPGQRPGQREGNREGQRERQRDPRYAQRPDPQFAGRGESRELPPERYGQREPYNARGPSGYGPRGGNEGYGGGEGRSRYSESQYGIGRGGRESYGRPDDQFGGQSGDSWRRPQGTGYGRPYADPARDAARSDWSSPDRWSDTGSGTREPSLGNRGGFGDRPFADNTESPGYFGTGNYGDGGASYGGGFDQRNRTRYPGSLDQDPMEWRGTGRGTPEQTRYRNGPKGYTRSDDRLREDISERLMIADSIDPSEVSVSVKDAKVTLEGHVPDRRMKHSIEDLVDQCPGVQDIDNRIRVGRPGSASANQGAGQLSSNPASSNPATSGAGSTGMGASSMGATMGTGMGTTSATNGGKVRKE